MRATHFFDAFVLISWARRLEILLRRQLLVCLNRGGMASINFNDLY